MWRFSAPFAERGESHHSAAADLSLSSFHRTGINGDILVLEEDGGEIDYIRVFWPRMGEAFQLQVYLIQIKPDSVPFPKTVDDHPSNSYIAGEQNS